MSRDRIIQTVALVLLVICGTSAGLALPAVLQSSDRYALEYTDTSVEGAPWFVAIGNAIGALRGVGVNILWIKIEMMKERGQYYEVMSDAELLTKLQPRYPDVWAFHGHNMAYNISVHTHTQAERWEWVQAGIRLVRNQGLRYNPNDLQLHKELAFWFAHKIDGYSDDAHIHYKINFAREWHFLLGAPPANYDARLEWMEELADAPESMDELLARNENVAAVLDHLERVFQVGDRLTEALRSDDEEQFSLDRQFLILHGQWRAIHEDSYVASELGYLQEFARKYPRHMAAFETVNDDPALAAAFQDLLLHLRKRVLLDEYNMDPQIMYEFTRDLGPIDWRHAQAHALYWAELGSRRAESRKLIEDEIYLVVNNDRVRLQAMQALAKTGRLVFDPFSNEMPSRYSEWAWIDAIFNSFEQLYIKHYETRGWGGDTFISFLENFMAHSVRELARAGETEEAEELMARMDSFFGTGAQDVIGSPKWSLPLDVFIEEEVKGQYNRQPLLAASDVSTALRRGIREGIGRGNERLFEQALAFSHNVAEYFRNNEMYGYENQFGRGRISEFIAGLERMLPGVYAQVMLDPTVPMQERATIWAQTDQFDSNLRAQVYDRMVDQLRRQYAGHPLSQKISFDELFPQPPGLEAYRQRMREEMARQEQQRQQQRQGDAVEVH